MKYFVVVSYILIFIVTMQLSEPLINVITSIHHFKVSILRRPITLLDLDTDFKETCHLYMWLRDTITYLSRLTDDNYFKLRRAKTKEYKNYLVYENCRIATEIYYLLNEYLPDIIEADKFNMLNTKNNCVKFHEKMYDIFDDVSDNMKDRRHQTDEQKHILKMLVCELTKFDTETLPRNYKFTRHNDCKNDYQYVTEIIDFDRLDGYYCL